MKRELLESKNALIDQRQERDKVLKSMIDLDKQNKSLNRSKHKHQKMIDKSIVNDKLTDSASFQTEENFYNRHK